MSDAIGRGDPSKDIIMSLVDHHEKSELTLPGHRWLRFEFNGWAPRAKAEVCFDPDDRRYIIDWIEGDPECPGAGGDLLRTVGAWADMNQMDGQLVCELDKVPFYQREGWVHTRPYLAVHEMTRAHR